MKMWGSRSSYVGCLEYKFVQAFRKVTGSIFFFLNKNMI